MRQYGAFGILSAKCEGTHKVGRLKRRVGRQVTNQQRKKWIIVERFSSDALGRPELHSAKLREIIKRDESRTRKEQIGICKFEGNVIENEGQEAPRQETLRGVLFQKKFNSWKKDMQRLSKHSLPEHNV
jgi:hypothetical protein